MPLKDATREIVALVERETGYPVKLLEKPELDTLATVRMARGNVPAHFIAYKPTRDESLDYLICYQCGFILRLFENPPDHRFDFGVCPQANGQVARMLVGPGSKLRKLGLGGAQLDRMASIFLDGLMTHLRSIPIGMRVADWILAGYPDLHDSQRAAVLKELDTARSSLQPQVREITPDRILRPTMSINAAYGTFWAEKYGMRELATPYYAAGYEAEGRALLKLWDGIPHDALHDRELVDTWAGELGLTDWYDWVPYVAPQ